MSMSDGATGCDLGKRRMPRLTLTDTPKRTRYVHGKTPDSRRKGSESGRHASETARRRGSKSRRRKGSERRSDWKGRDRRPHGTPHGRPLGKKRVFAFIPHHMKTMQSLISRGRRVSATPAEWSLTSMEGAAAPDSWPSRSAWGHRLTCGTAKGTHPCNSRHFRRSLTSPAPRHWL